MNPTTVHSKGQCASLKIYILPTLVEHLENFLKWGSQLLLPLVIGIWKAVPIGQRESSRFPLLFLTIHAQEGITVWWFLMIQEWPKKGKVYLGLKNDSSFHSMPWIPKWLIREYYIFNLLGLQRINHIVTPRIFESWQYYSIIIELKKWD